MPTQKTTSISTIIPRPIAKRQHSSPAGYGITHINLSDAAARIANGPRSCTNPFLNGSLSISEDTNSNAPTTINEIENELNDNSTLYTAIQERAMATKTSKTHPNPFSRKIDENSIFSFPTCSTNGNVNTFNANDDTINDAVNTCKTDHCALIQLDGVDDRYSRSSMSIGADAFENITSSSTQKQFRNRSQSDTQALDIDACNAAGEIKGQIDVDEQLETNPFVGGNIHKTVSDMHLENLATHRNRSASQTWSFGRSLSRQPGVPGYKIPVGGGDTTDSSDLPMARTISCESVNSESSVILADLEQQIVPAVTGLLCVGLQYDR